MLVALALALAAVAPAQDFKSLVQRAFDLHQKGQFNEALPLLRRAYSLDPKDYFVNLLLGIDSLRTGQAKDSVPFLKRAHQLRPSEEFPLDYLAEAYARQNAFPEAADTYLEVVRQARGSADSAVPFVDFAVSRFVEMSSRLRSSGKGLAEEYRLRAFADTDELARRSWLQWAADIDPAAPGIWADLARAALATQDTEAAGDYAQKALHADPDDLEARIVTAELAAGKTAWKTAIDAISAVGMRSPGVLSQAATKWPAELVPPASIAVSGIAAKFFSCVKSAAKACVLGRSSIGHANPALLYREQRWEQLIATRLPETKQTGAWLQRGVAYAHLQDCRHAIPTLEHGVAKTDFYGMYLLSWCYSHEAGRSAEQMNASASDDSALHMMRGDIFLRLQAKADLAESEYEAALAKSPNDPAILERLAEAQLGSGKSNAARETAQAALKIDPLRFGAKRTMAKVAMEDRDYATALPYLRELASHDPQDLTIRVELGNACAQTGALEEARDNLSPALAEGYPDEKGSLHYVLGSVLRKMGRTAEADKAMAVAVQLSEAFQQRSHRDQEPDAKP